MKHGCNKNSRLLLFSVKQQLQCWFFFFFLQQQLANILLFLLFSVDVLWLILQEGGMFISGQTGTIFTMQLELLSRIRHQHLVNLLGYSEHAGCRILIFQYAPNGTLYEHLHGYEHLTWKQRMRIISGIAYGLAYLHHSCDPPIIHGNLRSSNILLTEDYASKINGLGKVPILGGSELVTIRKPGGSFDSGNLGKAIHSRAGDVYAFGVLVLEVISGRLPFSEQTGILVQWASNILKNNERRMELADPSISDVSKPELFAVSEVARRCILQDPERRPAMKEVVETVGEELKIAMEMAAPATSPLTLRGLLDIP